jgi:hypothetical protein
MRSSSRSSVPFMAHLLASFLWNLRDSSVHHHRLVTRRVARKMARSVFDSRKERISCPPPYRSVRWC